MALKAHADGWNGNLKLDNGSKWRSHLYDTGLGADYSLRLGKALLNAGVHATHYSYNYLAHEISRIPELEEEILSLGEKGTTDIPRNAMEIMSPSVSK